MTASQTGEPGHARDERRFLLGLIGAFLLTRLLWLYAVHGGFDGFLEASEATRVALSVARQGTIGDAYYAGQGPTAHLMPLNPMIAGGLLRLLDPAGSAAHLILLAWSLGQVLCAYLLVRAVFVRLGMERSAIRWGSAVLLLLAPFVPQETVDFRYWEGASALCLVALNLLVMIPIERRGQLTTRECVIVPPLFALTCFVSPPSGVTVGACWAIVALRRLRFGQQVLLGGATLAMVALAITPWALRNATMLGEPVLTRSNLGLELALANHPAALSNADPAEIFYERLTTIHPAANAAAQAQVQSQGEVAYSRALARTTWDWIAAHPLSFVQLWLRHASEMIAPRPWQMYFTGWEDARLARAWTISIVQLAGLAGLLMLRRRYWMPALYVGATIAMLAVFQPMPRYIFAIYPFLVFPAADVVRRLLERAGRQSPPREPELS